MSKFISIIFIFLFCSAMLFAQAPERSLRIGDYLYGNAKGDTISGRMFITLDSFYIVYQVVRDSFLSAPVLKGTWDVNNNMKDVTLKFDNGNIAKGIFLLVESREDYLIQLQIGKYIWTRNWPR